jgi:hypothetical protein
MVATERWRRMALVIVMSAGAMLAFTSAASATPQVR